jgi:type IV pilus assembly protein PilB
MSIPAQDSLHNLAFVNLKEKQIPFPVLKIIPLEMAEKYHVLSFELNEKILKIAVVYPEQLKQGYLVALQDLGHKINRNILLFQTDANGLREGLAQYKSYLKGKEPASSISMLKNGINIDTKTPPPLFELGKVVAYNYLQRIPLQFSQSYRVVCIDYFPPNEYWFASDATNQPQMVALLKYIAKKNDLKPHLIGVTKKDLDDLLEYYTTVQKQIETKQEEQARNNTEYLKQEIDQYNKTQDDRVEQSRKAVMEGVKEIVQNKEPTPSLVQEDENGVIVPDAQGTLLTTELEKPGMAGIFQKFFQGVSGNNQPVMSEMEMENKVANINAASTQADPSPSGQALQNSASGGVNLSNTLNQLENKVNLGPTPSLIHEEPEENPTSPGLSPISPTGEPGPVPFPTPNAQVIAKEEAIQAKEAEKTAEAVAKKNTVISEDDQEIGSLLDRSVETVEELKEHIKKGFVPRIVAAIVNYAIHEKASDIHIEAFDDEVRVRYRIDGQLMDIVKLPTDIHAAIVSRIKILSKLRLDETRVPQDGRFDVNFEKAQVDLRVSVMPTVHGEKVVMRILEKSKGIASLESLGIAGLSYENLVKSINKPYGICLSTGPTGSGKSTSLYAILNRIATDNVNVVTLEDPVEYEMKGINQAQIRPKIGFTFAEGLRSVLRQDPNIIMVGEIRDGETANMATQAALTGHLVLSTLHTNDAAGAIPRLDNMGIEPFLITSSLNVAIGQRLVRKICDYCKKEVNLPAGIRAQVEKDLDEIEKLNPLDAHRVKRPVKFYQGEGCSHCNGTGYSGRIGIYEVLMMTDEIEELTIARASAAQIQSEAQKQGMLTMYQDGLLKVIAGITTIDEVLRETTNK